MLTIIGTVCLAAGSAGMGLFAVKKLDQRVKALHSLMAALELMEWELTYHLPVTGELFRRTAEKSSEPAAAFFSQCSEMLNRTEHSLIKIWSQSAHDHLSDLKVSDMEILATVGAVIGRYDAESQQRTISGARSQINQAVKKAIEDRQRLGRVYGVLGAVSGLFIAVLLL